MLDIGVLGIQIDRSKRDWKCIRDLELLVHEIC